MRKKASVVTVLGWLVILGAWVPSIPARAQEPEQKTLADLSAKMSGVTDPAMKAVYQDLIRSIKSKALCEKKLAEMNGDLKNKTNPFKGSCDGCRIGGGGRCLETDFTSAFLHSTPLMSPADSLKYRNGAKQEGRDEGYKARQHADYCSVLYRADEEYKRDVSAPCAKAIDDCPAVKAQKDIASNSACILDASARIQDDEGQVSANHVNSAQDYLTQFIALDTQYMKDLQSLQPQGTTVTGPQNPSTTLTDHIKLDMVKKRYLGAGGDPSKLPAEGKAAE